MKMRLMTYLWRLQQSQMIISMILWATLLTITSYEYVGWRLQQIFFNNIYFGFFVLFLIIFGIIVLIGFAFDRVLRLWKEQQIVAAQRNPYVKERIWTRDIVLWRHMFLPMLKKYEDEDPKVKEEMDFMEKWIEKCMKVDPNVRKEVEEVESWVLEN
ncbi:MAG: hypothetical protein KAI64_03450 [Thermoplasmata archaeon]|nr:hypothetical protein [Thermoplasmata archaeon]